MEQQKRLNRKLVYQGNIIGLYQDTIELPDGRIVSYDFIQHNGAAAVVPVREDGKILMVRQYRNAIDRITLEIPAGKKDEGEDGMLCAGRELEEETGYAAQKLSHLLTVDTWVAFCNERIEIYLAEDLKKTKQQLDEDEFIDVEAWDLDELMRQIFAGTIRDAKTIAALSSYHVKRSASLEHI